MPGPEKVWEDNQSCYACHHPTASVIYIYILYQCFFRKDKITPIQEGKTTATFFSACFCLEFEMNVS